MASADDHIVASLAAIDEDYVDGLRHRYPNTVIDAGRGVRLGVIHTGVGPHDEISIHGGRDYSLKPTGSNYGAAGSDHGTHVAGVYRVPAGRAAKGTRPGGRTPELQDLHRGRGDEHLHAVAILEAIDDGCDIINLSITMDSVIDLVATRVQKALDAGVIVVAAAGNNERQPLAFPASIDGVLRRRAWPHRDVPSGLCLRRSRVRPQGRGPGGLRGGFLEPRSRRGLPRAWRGTISTVGRSGWGVMDGTSQAAPVVSALAARVLSESGRWSTTGRSSGRRRSSLRCAHARKRSAFPLI